MHPRSNNVTTVRSVFIIDPRGRIRLKIDYPPSIGRNFDEILRAIDALQTTYRYPVLTPAIGNLVTTRLFHLNYLTVIQKALFPDQKKPFFPTLNTHPSLIKYILYFVI